MSLQITTYLSPFSEVGNKQKGTLTISLCSLLLNSETKAFINHVKNAFICVIVTFIVINFSLKTLPKLYLTSNFHTLAY